MRVSCPSFEEFKGLYNAAVDDAAGARPKAKAKAGVDAKCVPRHLIMWRGEGGSPLLP